MSVLNMPFSGEPSFIEEVTLETIPYRIKFNWIDRGEYWEMSFFDRDMNPLVTGIRLVLNEEFLARYPDRGLPAGQMLVVDATGNEAPIAFEDFTNGRLTLDYVESIQ